jgi:hypothetical protein
VRPMQRLVISDPLRQVQFLPPLQRLKNIPHPRWYNVLESTSSFRRTAALL